MIVGHTDHEVLQEIAAILWPSFDPERQWSSDTIQEVADVLLMLRPELQPWSSNCLVDHSWAGGALDCASMRRFQARVDVIHGLIPHEAIYAEDDTINALIALFAYNDDD